MRRTPNSSRMLRLVRRVADVLRRPFVRRLLLIAGFAVGTWLIGGMQAANAADTPPAPHLDAVRNAVRAVDRAVDGARTAARAPRSGLALSRRAPVVGAEHARKESHATGDHATAESARSAATDVGATVDRRLAEATTRVPPIAVQELVGNLHQRLAGLAVPLADVTAVTVTRTPVLSAVGPLIGIRPQLTTASGLIGQSWLGPARGCPATTYRPRPRGPTGACAAATVLWGRFGFCTTAGASCAPVRDLTGNARAADGDIPQRPPDRPAVPTRNTACALPDPATPNGCGDGARAAETHVADVLRAPRVDRSAVIRTAADKPAFFPD